MIKVNDKFEFFRDSCCWNLVEWRDGVNPKTKEPTRTKSVTYHTSLLQVCGTIIDRSAGYACDSAESIVNAIRGAKKDIFLAIQGGGHGNNRLKP